MIEKNEYGLEAMWLNFQLMQNHRGEFDFTEADDFYHMVGKCLTIINKALSVKGAKRRTQLGVRK